MLFIMDLFKLDYEICSSIEDCTAKTAAAADQEVNKPVVIGLLSGNDIQTMWGTEAAPGILQGGFK